MSSKRHLRRKSCEGKRRFDSSTDAYKAAASYMQQYGGWVGEYKCKFCGHFHIGHLNHRRKQAIIAQRGQR